MWGTLRKEKAIQMHLANWILLAQHEERCGRICEEVPWVLGTNISNPHSSPKFTEYGYPMAIPHMIAGFGGTS